LRFQAFRSFGGQFAISRGLLFKACPLGGILFLRGHLFESDGLLEVFGQHFHRPRRTTPSGWIALSLPFAGQMRERIFH
jgi:hypothetical protein